MSPEQPESLVPLARRWLSEAQRFEDASYEVPPGEKREKCELQAKTLKTCGEQLLRRLEAGPKVAGTMTKPRRYMVRIAVAAEAFDAVAVTLPFGSERAQ